MLLSRRSLVKAVLMGSAGTVMPAGLKMAFGAQSGAPVLVSVLLRGAMDGLNLVAPSDDADLHAARPATLYPNNSGTTPGFALANGPSANDWRLHANASGLNALYQAKQLAFIHAAGIPADSRSHFQMQAFAEHGVVDQLSLNNANGWIARYGAATGLNGSFSLLSSDAATPASLSGAPLAVSMPDPKQFNAGSAARTAFLQAAYKNSPGALGAAGRTALSTVASFATVSSSFTAPPAGTYGTDPLSKALSVVAEVIKLNTGLQVAEAEFSDWDTHVSQQSRFANSVTTLSAGLSNFMKDMTASGQKVTMVVMSEFGRRVKSNASGGTDHGHGNVMMVLSSAGTLKGGRIYGQWKGLNPSVLDLGDVPVTTDYRAVLSEVIAKTRNDLPASLFPGFAATAPLGVVLMSFTDLVARRFTFGPRFNDPQPVLPSTPGAWFSQQLKAPSADDPAVANRLASVLLPITTTDSAGVATTTAMPLGDLAKTPAQLWQIKSTDTSANTANTRRPADEVIAASWIRGAFSPWQLQEVMVDFWHNHFSVDAYQNNIVAMMWPAYDQVLRANALGNFRTMLGTVAKSASMMYYLNQAQSYKQQPNENYAREVMELHTLGVARYLGEIPPTGLSAQQLATAGYSDQDVTNAARLLTGWTIADGSHADATGAKPNTGDFIFSPSIHYAGAQVIFGHTIPDGGQAAGETFLDLLAAHPGTANTIATKLYVHFVGDMPASGDGLVAQLAQTYLSSVHAADQIPQLLTVLFNSAEFAASAGQKVKMPFAYLVSLLRASGAEVNPQSNLTFGLSSLGAPLFQWPTPNGMPDLATAWTGTNDMLRRWALGTQVTAQSSKILADGPGTVFAQIPVGLSSPGSVVYKLAPMILGNTISSDTLAALVTYAATSEALGAKGALSDATKLLAGVRTLVGAMAGTPEFQLR